MCYELAKGCYSSTSAAARGGHLLIVPPLPSKAKPDYYTEQGLVGSELPSQLRPKALQRRPSVARVRLSLWLLCDSAVAIWQHCRYMQRQRTAASCVLALLLVQAACSELPQASPGASCSIRTTVAEFVHWLMPSSACARRLPG